MICSKCSIDKEITQYASYYHSTQNKIRTRKVCNSCFNEQKRLYRESIQKKKIIEPVPISISFTPIPTNIPTPVPEPFVESKVFINMDSKVCYTCKVEKPLTDFYFHKRTNKPFTSCKRCEIDKDKNEYQQFIEENGGSEKVRLKPGEWVDKYQQEQTESFLKILGWEHNGKHWFKEGVRSGTDGIWEKMRGKKKYRKPQVRNKPNVVTQRLMNHIEDIIKLRDAGETYKTIASIYNTSIPTLYKILEKYYEKN